MSDCDVDKVISAIEKVRKFRFVELMYGNSAGHAQCVLKRSDEFVWIVIEYFDYGRLLECDLKGFIVITCVNLPVVGNREAVKPLGEFGYGKLL